MSKKQTEILVIGVGLAGSTAALTAAEWNDVGVVKTPLRLRRAQTILKHLQSEVEVFYQRVKLTSEIIGLRNGVQMANALVFAATESRDSLGTHFIQSDE